jgi:hypothetical protein
MEVPEGAQVARWKRLLFTNAGQGDEPLYDEFHGIREEILLAFGFHTEYLSFDFKRQAPGTPKLKEAGPNSVPGWKIYKAFKGRPEG